MINWNKEENNQHRTYTLSTWNERKCQFVFTAKDTFKAQHKHTINETAIADTNCKLEMRAIATLSALQEQYGQQFGIYHPQFPTRETEEVYNGCYTYILLQRTKSCFVCAAVEATIICRTVLILHPQGRVHFYRMFSIQLGQSVFPYCHRPTTLPTHLFQGRSKV